MYESNCAIKSNKNKKKTQQQKHFWKKDLKSNVFSMHNSKTCKTVAKLDLVCTYSKKMLVNIDCTMDVIVEMIR